MTTPSSASLFSARPKGGSFDVRYRQGVIVEWNPATLENIIEVSGEPLVNLPVLGVAEAASYVPGITVGLHLMDPGEGRAQTWAIVGRFVVPGTQDVTDALSALGSRIQSDTVLTSEAASGGGAFQDLATVGPTVTVTVGASGKLLVIMSCVTGDDATGQNGGYMSFELSGANTLGASSQRSANIIVLVTPDGDSVRATVTGQALLTGLNPGITVVQAKYTWGTAAGAVFSERVLTAFAL